MSRLPPVIDAHTHCYPPEVAADPVAWGVARGERHWAALVAPGGLQGWATQDQMLRDMDAAGVELAVLQGWYWEHQETCELQNRWHLEWQRAHPDRFVALATVQPRAGAAALDALRQALDAGLAGVGELHPAVQGFSLDDPAWLQLAALCDERGLPVCFHATEPAGRTYAGRAETPLMDYVRLAQRFPGLKIVLAHWGGGLPFYELNRWCRATLRNVYYDTAASPLLYDARIWRMALDLVGADKLLFGTDYPLLVRPKSVPIPSFQPTLDDCATAALSEAERTTILRRSALKVYAPGRLAEPSTSARV